MPLRPLALAVSAAALAVSLAACGGDSERPSNAYVRLSDGDGTSKVGRHWYLDGPNATVGWTAHGAAQGGEPTTLRITRLTGACEAAQGAACPDGSDLTPADPEIIELPADGTERSGSIAVRDLETGARTRVSVKLCREDECWSSAMREYRRASGDA